MKSHYLAQLLLAAGICVMSPPTVAGAIHHTELFNDHALLALPQEDNWSGNFVSFPLNFFGAPASTLSVSSNGFVSNGNMWPINFNQMAQNVPFLAPFFANVDRRDGGTIQWGFDVMDGRQVLGAQWLNVHAYNHRPDKTNSFQIILTDRSDVEAGAFDFEFNYDRISWDTADSVPGDPFPGEDVARVGWYSKQSGALHEFAGSGVAGALLDSNTETGLIHHSRNSDVLGRYVFQVRGGEVLPEVAAPSPSHPVPAPGTLSLLLGGLGLMGYTWRRAA